MDFDAYLTPVVASGCIMAISYMLGKLGYSIIWTVFMILAHCTASYLWKIRQKKKIILQHAASWEKDLVLTHLKDLPSWVHFPDTERVEWINKVIYQLWPNIAIFAKAFIKNIVEPEIKSHLPHPLRLFNFQEIDLGTIPLRVGGIKVYTENVGRDKIIIDMDVAYAGDCNFVIHFGPFKGGLRQMQFKGKLRAILTPLVPKPPIIGAVSLFFLDEPVLDFDLTGLGELIELPGLMLTIRSLVTKIISSICVLPNEIIVPLMTETDIVKLQFAEPDGVIKFEIAQARNLENKDNIFSGKSDPYVIACVGAQFFKTKTIDNNLNPIWKETFEAVVDQASGQRIIFEVFDHDPGSSDEFIGRLVLPIDSLRDNRFTDEWYPLEGVKTGEIRIISNWQNVSSNKPLYEQSSTPKTSSAILMVYLDSINNLTMIKRDLEPSPFVELSFGNQTQKSVVRPKTCNPIYQQKFTFFIHTVQQQHLKIEVNDGLTTKRFLGELQLPIKFLIDEPQMELMQHTFDVKLGPHASPIVLSLRLRFLHSEIASIEEPDDLFKDAIDKNVSSTTYDLNIAGATVKRDRQYMKNPLNEHKTSGILQTKTTITPYSFEKTKSNVQKNSGQQDQPAWFNVTFSGGTQTTADKRKSSSVLRRIQNNKFLSFGKLNKRRSLSTLFDGDLGRLNATLAYDIPKSKFSVELHRAEQLKSVNFDGVADPYASVKLFKNGNEVVGKMRTSIRSNTLQPVFNETAYFTVHHSDLPSCVLNVEIKDSCNYGWLKRSPIMGCVYFDLAQFDINQPANIWFPLVAPSADRSSHISIPTDPVSDK